MQVTSILPQPPSSLMPVQQGKNEMLSLVHNCGYRDSLEVTQPRYLLSPTTTISEFSSVTDISGLYHLEGACKEDLVSPVSSG